MTWRNTWPEDKRADEAVSHALALLSSSLEGLSLESVRSMKTRCRSRLLTRLTHVASQLRPVSENSPPPKISRQVGAETAGAQGPAGVEHGPAPGQMLEDGVGFVLNNLVIP